MVLNIYTTSDDTRIVNKTLTAVTNVTAIPVDNISILNPAFIIEYNPNILTANYCYIPEFGRYYYINNVSVITGNRMIIDCNVDVLKTYANDIGNCNCICARSESIGTPTQIPDKNLPIDPNREDIVSIVFSNDPLNVNPGDNIAKCWQLTTIGTGAE